MKYPSSHCGILRPPDKGKEMKAKVLCSAQALAFYGVPVTQLIIEFTFLRKLNFYALVFCFSNFLLCEA